MRTPILISFLLFACSQTIDSQMIDEFSTVDAGPPMVEPDAATEPQLERWVISQGIGSPVIDANVNCRYGELGHADTRHFRVFPSATIGDSKITEAILPIEVATSPEGMQPATLRLHRLTGNILAGEFELLSEVDFTVPDQMLGEVRVPLNIDIAPEDSVVLEVEMADGAQQRNLRFGHNREPQTAPTYYASASCGRPLPVNLATVANPLIVGETFAANSWLVSLGAEGLR